MIKLRGSVFALLALTSMLPSFHGIGKLGWTEACRQTGAQQYLSEALVAPVIFVRGKTTREIQRRVFQRLGTLVSAAMDL